MEKHNYDAGLPATNAPFNLCVRHGDLIFISGLPPFDEAFSRAVREAREQGRAVPPFPNPPFAEQVRLVMDNMKKLVEAAGSNMDCLLKVIVWLKDQRQAEEFDRIYRTYFSSREALPARTRILQYVAVKLPGRSRAGSWSWRGWNWSRTNSEKKLIRLPCEWGPASAGGSVPLGFG